MKSGQNDNWLADHFHRWGEMFDHDTRNRRAAEYLARRHRRFQVSDETIDQILCALLFMAVLAALFWGAYSIGQLIF